MGDGWRIRPFLPNPPITFEVEPYCGCCVVYSPNDFGGTPEKPMVVKFISFMCIMGHKNR